MSVSRRNGAQRGPFTHGSNIPEAGNSAVCVHEGCRENEIHEAAEHEERCVRIEARVRRVE